MVATPHYYVYPFGINADDLTAIPDNAAVDGSVSYYAGWTDPYEYDLLTNPAALPIPRGQMNQLFFDITLNIQEYQQYGTPQWVAGNTVLYPIYARVYYNNLVYENQVSNNTATPGADATWNVVSGNTGGLPIGTIIDYAGIGAPTDFISCNGSAVSRTTYANLLDVLTQVQNGTTTNTLNTVSGLTNTADMYIGMPIEGTGIPSGTTIASIVDGTDITMSANATASGTVAITFFNWGNGDGSTTFNLPDLRRSVTVGYQGSGTSVLGNVPGQYGGVESHSVGLNEIPNHTHDAPSGHDYIVAGSPNNVYQGAANQGTISTITGDISGYSAQTALSLIQPSAIVTKCIKYR